MRRPPVTRVALRYTATHDQVNQENTGHAESVKVVFDPSKITYGQLLWVFFSVVHDPTQRNRQGPDVGESYRSVIFYASEEQQKLSKDYIAQLDAAKVFPKPIVTEVVPLKGFTMRSPIIRTTPYITPIIPTSWSPIGRRSKPSSSNSHSCSRITKASDAPSHFRNFCGLLKFAGGVVFPWEKTTKKGLSLRCLHQLRNRFLSGPKFSVLRLKRPGTCFVQKRLGFNVKTSVMRLIDVNWAWQVSAPSKSIGLCSGGGNNRQRLLHTPAGRKLLWSHVLDSEHLCRGAAGVPACRLR